MASSLFFHWPSVSSRSVRVGVLLSLFLFLGLSFAPTVFADELEDLQKQIQETTHQLQLSVSATKPLEQEVNKLGQRIQSALATIKQLNEEQKRKDAEIAQRELELADQYQLLRIRVDQQYRQLRRTSLLTTLLASTSALDAQKHVRYAQILAQRDRGIIDGIGGNIIELQQAKLAAQKRAQQLASLQTELDKQKAFFEKEITGAKKYQQDLQGKIAALSAKQQQILAEKTGTAQTSVGDIPLVGDPNARPDFNPGFSPAFAVFSFGAPHFKGMSQYGALGRAKSGKNAEDILKAYYGDVEIKKVDMPGSISVDGVGSMPFEGQYLRGIAEMPSQWADQGGYEALKAQAIAARTYALAYTGWTMSDRSTRKGICATESCQVYKRSKFDAGGRWHDAVRDTEGMVVVSKATGNIFSTWYASTSGGHQISYTSMGHTTPALWDTTSEWSNWVAGAYEKTGGSPWFYMGWYKSRSGDACGRSHPWLNQEEFADILNSWVVRKKGSGSEVERIAPLGPCWGGTAYSYGEMRDKAKNYGEEYTSVSGVRIEHSSAGSTSRVVLQTNRGEVGIPGSEFKEVFNLRAPGRIAIKGKLFGIEKK